MCNYIRVFINVSKPSLRFLRSYSLHFKIKVTFEHKLRYGIKITFGEISLDLKLRQTNWNVTKYNVNVVVEDYQVK